MPFTYNGIGTHYYGRRHREVRYGTCEHCGRQTRLESYETTLWFVIGFLPILPLKRVMVFDYCTRCSRHRYVPLAQWQTIQQEAVDKSRQAAEAAPDDAAAAMEHQQTLATCHQDAEAEAAANDLLDRFGDRADVQMHAGAWYEKAGRDAEADACFQRALAIDPTDRAARRAVAIGHLQHGRPDAARALLDFMEAPGPDQDAGVLVLLAKAYQRDGRHEEALDLLEKAMRGQPTLEKDRAFRRTVRQSEKQCLGRTPFLPSLPFYRRRAVLVGGAVLAAAAILFGISAWLTEHRNLYVVNGFSRPIAVAIDGGAPMRLRAAKYENVTLGEGHHTARVTWPDGHTSEMAFDLATPWWRRLTESPLFVLNPGGAGVILWEEVTYSTHPSATAPYHYRLYTGQPMVALSDINYPFQHAPKEIQIEGGSQTKRTRVSLLELDDPAGFLAGQTESLPAADLMTFAEAHLENTPEDERLLQAYALAAAHGDQRERYRRFLAARLVDRPVRIEWHRYYQQNGLENGDEATLVKQYDALLAAEPQSAVLLYLRGRLCARRSEAMAYDERALAADPTLAYAWYGKAYHLRAVGDYAAARAAMAEACRLKPDDVAMAEMWFQDRLALGEYEALLTEVRATQAKTPLDWNLYARQMTLCEAMNQPEAAQQAFDDYAAHLRREFKKGAETSVRLARIKMLYATNRYDELVQEAQAIPGPQIIFETLFLAHLVHGNLDEASRMTDPMTPGNEWAALWVSLGWCLKGDRAQAETWRKRAQQQLAGGNSDDRAAAELLGSATAPSMEAVDDLSGEPLWRAAVLLALADQHPEIREALLAEVRQICSTPIVPQQFLRQVAEALAARQD